LALYQQAFRVLRKLEGDEGFFRSVDLLLRGVLLRESGVQQEAVRSLQESLDLARKALGSDHAYVALVLHELARALEKRHQDAEAEQYYRDCLRIAEQFGLEHPKVSLLLGSFSTLLQRRGKRPEAEALLDRALTARVQKYGPNHNLVGDVLVIQARLLNRPSESSQRDQLLRRAVSIYSQTPGPPRRALRACLHQLARSVPADELFAVACELGASAARRPETNDERGKYFDLAVETLERAAGKGFRDVARVREAPELAGLRMRPAFQQVLGKLEHAKPLDK
jgi:tetratricopeptide (TPR) repeat protein